MLAGITASRGNKTSAATATVVCISDTPHTFFIFAYFSKIQKINKLNTTHSPCVPRSGHQQPTKHQQPPQRHVMSIDNTLWYIHVYYFCMEGTWEHVSVRWHQGNYQLWANCLMHWNPVSIAGLRVSRQLLVWNKHEKMSLCTGIKVITSYDTKIFHIIQRSTKNKCAILLFRPRGPVWCCRSRSATGVAVAWCQ